MNIIRETVVKVTLDDGKVLQPGDHCIFFANGMICTGLFQGVTKRGSLEFAAKIGTDTYKFAVMPASIKEMEIL